MTLALLLCAGLLAAAPVHPQNTTENCPAQSLALANADSTSVDNTGSSSPGARPAVTWVLHKNRELGFALNDGEMNINTIQ